MTSRRRLTLPSAVTEYRVLRMPRHETLRVRGLDMHLRRWGPPPSDSAPPVFLLHGWQDTGDTFQFMVDALRAGLAPGGARLARFRPQRMGAARVLVSRLPGGSRRAAGCARAWTPARLVGHSMGGNIASLYAGLRPERVRCVVNLEGFGLARTSPEQAPAQLRKWLDQVKSGPALKDYASFEQLAGIIRLPLSAILGSASGVRGRGLG